MLNRTRRFTQEAQHVEKDRVHARPSMCVLKCVRILGGCVCIANLYTVKDMDLELGQEQEEGG